MNSAEEPQADETRTTSLITNNQRKELLIFNANVYQLRRGLFMFALLLSCFIMTLPPKACAALEGDYEYSVTTETVTITKYHGTDKHVLVPDTLGGKPVTALGKKAFAGCNMLNVVVPDGVTNIGIDAFTGATAWSVYPYLQVLSVLRKEHSLHATSSRT